MFSIKHKFFINFVVHNNKLNSYHKARICKAINRFVNSYSFGELKPPSEEECLDKIIYNEILLNIKLKKLKVSRSTPTAFSLKYLANTNEGNQDPHNFTEKAEPPKIFHLPFEVTNKYIIEADLDESIVNEIPKNVANLTPSDEVKIKSPKLWSLKTDLTLGDLATNHESESPIRFGTPDPRIPISNIPCGGCGALLHCNAEGIPGYIPKEVFCAKRLRHLKSEICQRCYFLREYNTALGVNVSPIEYKRILKEIHSKKALAVIMVDLLDFPCSIWSGILDLIGEKPIIIVGNKIDLFMQENKSFLNQIKHSLLEALESNGIPQESIIQTLLISAKTGYGVENLINVLNKNWGTMGDMYLIGCTNVGKSTLFNALIKSDICRIEAESILHRATISPWPGTTLNLLKFPIKRLYGQLMRERTLRLNTISINKKIIKQNENNEKHEKRSIFMQQRLMDSISRTRPFVGKHRKENFYDDLTSEFDLNKSEMESSGLDPRNPLFLKSKWFYDTPGVVQNDQIINFLTTSELILTLPNQMVIPRIFKLEPGTSLFIGGLARVDFISLPSKNWISVFASKFLPITITKTENAETVYNSLLGSNLFRVPCGGIERLSKWPKLESKEVEIVGRILNESAGDVVLSSAGWISVYVSPSRYCTMKAWTPLGKGIHMRKTPVIKTSHKFVGPRIPNTPAYRVPIKIVETKSLNEHEQYF